MINSTDELLGFFQVKPIKINEYILIFHAKFIKPPFNMSYPLHLAFMMSYINPPPPPHVYVCVYVWPVYVLVGLVLVSPRDMSHCQVSQHQQKLAICSV